MTDRSKAAHGGRPSLHKVALPGSPGRDHGPGLAEAVVACAVVLARYAGTDSFVLPVLPEGPDGRTVHLPVDLTAQPSYRVLLADVRAALRSGGTLPESAGSHGSAVAEGPLPVRVIRCGRTHLDTAADTGWLSLAVDGDGDGPGGGDAWLVVPPHALPFDAAERLRGHLGVLAAAAAADPDLRVTELPLLTPAEEQLMLVEWNRTAADLPHDRCLHEHFQDRAAAQPDAVAVWESGRATTFAQVNARANRLARRLIGLGVAPGAVVGVTLPRSADLLVALLAVLKAGGCYLPMDPAYPAERLAFLRRDGACDVVLATPATAAALPEGPGRLLTLSPSATGPEHRVAADRADPDEVAGAADRDLPGRARPDDLCYVIHTSGSTGEPKGIELRHRGVVNNLTDLNGRFGVGPGDTVLALSSPGFDLSVYEFLGITAAGGTVVVPEPESLQRPAHWADLVQAHHVTVWNSAPALLELFVEHAERRGLVFPGLKVAMLGGDWIGVSLPGRLRALAPDVRVAALGGATESSIHSTLYEVPTTGQPDWPSVPYGRPLANQRLYILDPAGRPVPVGVPGELHLAGVGLARGYAGRADLTAERFHLWHHPAVGEDRLYRTGDLARYHPDGLVELLGRLDFQVKISGVRIELGEIEHHLRRVRGVRQAVAVATAGSGERRLVGYVVPYPTETVDPAAVRTQLAERLPAAMVPAAVVVTEDLPLSPNGKIDRRRLTRTPPAAADRRPTAERDRDPDEERVAEVWAHILDVPPPGPDADFFALGGDSFRALRAMSLLAPDQSPAELFKHRTVEALAARLRALRRP
ncbi:amino acid adenylation domain-containing protein [Streptomyces canus]|uniref:non-ribosomal peptide synthetase n=1 Tax=Streptomyces canus TaxID=58343 RepID=UPI00371BAB49